MSGFRCGTIAIVGRPNVGKSTLLNRLVGQKLSITSRKPQTTRYRLNGILTRADAQYIFVDTPGYQMRHKSALNRAMNRTVTDSLRELDVALLVLDAGHLEKEDRDALAVISADTPLVIAVNKIDKLAGNGPLLEFLRTVAALCPRAELVPVSARLGKNMAELLKTLRAHLPVQPAVYAADDLTDRSERFLAAELLREKLFRLTGDELPYGSSVTIEKYEEEGRMRRIHAAIIVEKDSHKAMVIGNKGAKLKEIATAARLDMEKLFGGKVFLQVWVKVKSGWTDDERALRTLGFGDF
jgi:GTP-binding protein Era